MRRAVMPAGMIRRRSPWSPKRVTRVPARTGPMAYPMLPPTTKYEVNRPRFDAVQSRETMESAEGWNHAWPRAETAEQRISRR
jgi:hypothetical protein